MARIRLFPLILFATALVLGALLAAQWKNLPDAFSIAREVPFDKASKTARGADGSYAVVFDANKKIARIDANGELIYLLSPSNAPEKGFSFANEIALAPDGSLYVSTTYIDPESLTVNREAIIRFSPRGYHAGVLHVIEHASEALVDNIGLVRGLTWTPDGVRFCIGRDEGIHDYLLHPASGTLLAETTTPFANARNQIIYASVSADGREMAFTTAATEMYTAIPGKPPIKRYDGRERTEFSIPADIHFLAGEWYFSDLGRDAIMRLTGDGRAEAVFDAQIARALGYIDTFFECKNFQIDPANLTLPNNGKVVHLTTGDSPSIRLLDRAQGNALLWIKRVAIWLQLTLLGGIVIALIRLAVRNATPEGLQAVKQVGLVALMVSTAVGVTATMIFNNMNHRLEQEAAKNLRGYLEVGRIVVNADAIDRIDHVKHYMNADYQAVLAQLRQTISREGTIAASTYSGVYKVIGNKVAALAYHDGLRGIFYPYDYQYDKSIYAKVAETGTTYLGEMADIYGNWLTGVVRLHNSRGELVGFLEVGMDQSAHREANLALFMGTLIDLAMILFVLVFVFSEIGFFSSRFLDRPTFADPAARQRYDEGALRFVSFLAIASVFFSASFLPLYSKSLAAPIGWLPFDMVIGLPMVIETLSGAVIAMLYGHVWIRLGLKTDIVLGCLIVATGMALTALVATFQGLIIGRLTVGLGMGLLMIAFRTYFLIEKDEGRKESGIIALTVGVTAGINVGSVSGGMLAARIGMQSVFWVQSALLVLAAAAGLLLIRNRHRNGSARAIPFSLFAFLSDRAVWSFFLFAFLPITACGLFLGFLFPLFAESQGLSTNEISLAFMMFGVASVYLGPSLTRLTWFLFGARRAVAFGAMVMVGALLLFAAFQTLTAAYIAVVLFGLTDSFIFNQGLSYFSSLRSVDRLGEDKAIGVYSVFEAGGEALGPMAFGLAMSLSLGVGIAGIAVALAASTGIFLALSPSIAGERP
jgi:predicted MFS family arabinose efflux permease